MTVEEKEIMTLTIKNAMLEGFEAFAKTMNDNIEDSIENHKKSCFASVRVNRGNSDNSFTNAIKNWKTIAVTIGGIAWIVSTIITVSMGKPLPVFTPEQVKQIAQQVQEVTNPKPITENR
jgi:hypothetical protein